jgi:hypothetical protein
VQEGENVLHSLVALVGQDAARCCLHKVIAIETTAASRAFLIMSTYIYRHHNKHTYIHICQIVMDPIINEAGCVATQVDGGCQHALEWQVYCVQKYGDRAFIYSSQRKPNINMRAGHVLYLIWHLLRFVELRRNTLACPESLRYRTELRCPQTLYVFNYSIPERIVNDKVYRTHKQRFEPTQFDSWTHMYIVSNAVYWETMSHSAIHMTTNFANIIDT